MQIFKLGEREAQLAWRAWSSYPQAFWIDDHEAAGEVIVRELSQRVDDSAVQRLNAYIIGKANDHDTLMRAEREVEQVAETDIA